MDDGYCNARNIIFLHIHTIGYTYQAYEFEDEDMVPYAKCYLEERNKVQGKDPGNVSDDEVEMLLWQIRINWVVSNVSFPLLE